MRRESDKWVKEHEIAFNEQDFQKYLMIDSTSLAAYSYYYAKDKVIRLGADLISWLFMFDDYYGEGRKVSGYDNLRRFFDTILETYLTGIEPKERTTHHPSLLNLKNRFSTFANDRWHHSFCNSLEGYFFGCLQEYEYRLYNSLPTLEEFRQYRVCSIGVYPVLDLIEFTLPNLLSDNFLSLERVKESRSLSCELCSIVNDIFSFKKEELERETNNIVKVIANEFTLSIDEAFDTAIELHDEGLQKLDRNIECIAAKSDKHEEVLYMHGLRHWVTGAYYWHMTSLRYS